MNARWLTFGKYHMTSLIVVVLALLTTSVKAASANDAMALAAERYSWATALFQSYTQGCVRGAVAMAVPQQNAEADCRCIVNTMAGLVTDADWGAMDAAMKGRQFQRNLDIWSRYRPLANERCPLQRDVERQVDTSERLLALGKQAYDRGDMLGAVSQWKAAYEARRQSIGERNPRTLAAGWWLARAYRGAGRLEEALQLRTELLSGWKAVVGTEGVDSGLPGLVFDIAQSLDDLGRPEALGVLESLVNRLRHRFGDQDKKTLRAMHSFANALRLRGRHSDALVFQRYLHKIARERSDLVSPEALLSIRNNLAITLAAMGRGTEALRIMPQLREVDELSSSAPEMGPDAQFQSNWSQIYATLGRFQEALPFAERSATASAARLGPTHPDTVWATNNLATILLQTGDFGRAVALLEDVERNFAQGSNPRSLLRTTVLSNLASAYMVAGRLADSARVARMAVQFQVDGPQAESVVSALALVRLSQIEVLTATGAQDPRLANAEKLAERAYSVLSRNFGDTHTQSIGALVSLIHARLVGANPAPAIPLVQRFVSTTEAMRAQTGVSARDRRAMFAPFAEMYRVLSIGYGPAGGAALYEGLRFAELGKGRGLLDAIGVSDAAADGMLPEREQRQVQEIRRQLAELEARSAESSSLEELQRLDAKHSELLETLGELSAKFRERFPAFAERLDPGVIPVNSLQGLVPENAVAISFVLAQQQAGAWILEGSGRITFISLGILHGLDSAVEATRLASSTRGGLRPALREEGKVLWRMPQGHYLLDRADAVRPQGATPVEHVDEVAKWLSAKLLTPLSSALMGKTRWIVAPDGPLAYLPLEVLPFGAARVLDAAEVHYTASLSVYARLRERQRAYAARDRPRDLLAFGDPYYEAPPGSAEARKAVHSTRAPMIEAQLRDLAGLWPRLPDSAREVESIGRQFKSADVFTLQDASEARLVRMARSGQLKDYRRLHFATHGFLSRTDPSLSSVVLSQRGGSYETDGYVTAAEWAGYELQSDLVVLSACSTALSKSVVGEGVLGLPHALSLAGNINMIVTLWDVFDNTTAKFMGRFYELMLQGQSTAAALTATKREFAKQPKTSEPVFWAPFLLIGVG